MPKIFSASFLYFLAAFFLVILTAVNMRGYLVQSQVLGTTTSKNSTDAVLTNEKQFWEYFLTVNPTYLPGWIELSRVEFKLGNTENAKAALNRATQISPNVELEKLVPELGQVGKL